MLVVYSGGNAVFLDNFEFDVVELLLHHEETLVGCMLSLPLLLPALLVGGSHKLAVFAALLLSGDELRYVVPAEGVECDAEVVLEHFVAVDYFPAVEPSQYH